MTLIVGKQLSNGASTQRKAYRTKTIQPLRFDLLSAAGFVWDTDKGAEILEKLRGS